SHTPHRLPISTSYTLSHTTLFRSMRGILQEEETNLLGVTLRYVKANNETALSYAPKADAFAVILYFNEIRSTDGRAKADKLISQDRKSTRLNSSHGSNSYAVFCSK